MDVRSWRKIMLQWMTECNFVDHNYFNIEQTNIDEFFRNFCLKHKSCSEFDCLKSFLETHYPDFQPHVDDENALSAADYIYIYSLLLHFCCVKCPDEHFHGICQRLSENTQQCIAAFFKNLLNCASIDKELLRHAIAEVAKTHNSSPPVPQNKNDSISSGASSTGAISAESQTSFSSSPLGVTIDSPLRTPNRKVVTVVQRISPNTPKSYLLEERTRELYNYKAQLETERYEKGLLEVQIMQNEQQMYSLNQIQKKMQQQIQALKDEILNQSVEPNKNQEDEQLQKRLYRKIHEGEDEIFRLNDRIRNLNEEKTLLENKLRLAEKKVVEYRETIHEMELKLTEFATELEKKDSTIKCLCDDKAELEHFIAESRTASRNSRPDFNSSADCLDSSFTRHTNSSSSVGSPENLGVSVVDVQLREKEHENAQLHDELAEMHANNKKLSDLIKENTESYKIEYNFEIIDAAIIRNDREEDPIADFNSFLDCMNHLSNAYKEAKIVNNNLEYNISSLQGKNNELKSCLDCTENEIRCLKENLHNAEKKIGIYKYEMDNLVTTKDELAHKYGSTLSELLAIKQQSKSDKTDLENYIKDLNEKIQEQTQKIETFDIYCNDLVGEKESVQQKCNEIQTELQQLSEQNQALQKTIDFQNTKMQTHIEAEMLVKQNYEQLLIKNEEIYQELRGTKAHLQTMTADITKKELEMNNLGKEIVQLGKYNAEREERMEKITLNFEEEKSKRDKQILELQQIQADLENKLQEKSRDHAEIENKFQEICKSLRCVFLMDHKKQDATEYSPIDQLNDVKESFAELVKEKSLSSKKIEQLEKENRQIFEQKQNLKQKLQLDTERYEEILRHHKKEFQEINAQFTKTQRKTEKLETFVRELQEKHKQTVTSEQQKIQELQETNEKLRTKQQTLMNEQQEEHRSWKSKHEQLEAELKGEKEICAAKDTELKLQIAKLSQFKVQIVNYENQIQKLQETQNSHIEKITNLETRIEKLQKENEELVAKLKAKETELTQTANELLVQTTKYEQTTEHLKATELELERLHKTTELVQNDAAKKIATMESTLDVLEKEKQNLELALKHETATLQTKANELLKCTQDQKATLEQLKSLEIQLDEEKTFKQNLNKRTEELEKRFEELQQTYAIARTSFEEQKSILEENIKALRSQNDLYAAELKTLKDAKIDYEDKIQKSDKDLKLLTTELEKQTSKVTERNIKIKQSQDMLTDASKKLEEKTKIWNKMHLTCEKQSEELDNLRKEMSQLQELHQKQTGELETYKATNIEQIESLLASEDEIKTIQNQLKETECRLAERIDEIKNLEQNIKILETTQAKTKAALEQVSEEKNGLNVIVTEKQQHIEQINGLLKETESCLKSVNDECTKLQSEIVAKEAELRMFGDELQQVQESYKNEVDTALGTVKFIEKAILDVVHLVQKSLINCKIENKNIDTAINGEYETSVLKLKDLVNAILVAFSHQQNEINQIPTLRLRLKELNEQQMDTLQDYKKLKAQYKAKQQKIDELIDENKLLERKLEKENEQFAQNLQNLEQVNEKLNQQHETLQLKLSNKDADLKAIQLNYGMLKAANERLTLAQESLDVEYTKTFDALSTERQRMKESLDEKENAFQLLQQDFDELQRSMAQKEDFLQKNLKQTEMKLENSNTEKQKQLKTLENEKAANVELAKKCEDLESKNVELTKKTEELQKECIRLRGELAALNEKFIQQNDELESSASQLDEANANCKDFSEKLTEINANNQRLERSLVGTEEKLNAANIEIDTLTTQNDSLLEEKQKLNDEINKNKRDCQDLRQALHNLSQKYALGDLEKEDLRRQLDLLNKQIEVKNQYQTTSESKLKNVVETTHALERNLLSTENALKTSRTMLDQSKSNTEKLDIENKKLQENVESLTKRIEKMALKLGEWQARSTKYERENEKFLKTNEMQITAIEVLQREREIQQLECKTLKERLSKLERLHDQSLSRLQTAEKSNATLLAARQKFETSEIDLQSKLTKVESSRHVLEERLRKTTHDYEQCERENVNLNHQIGALNTEIQMLKNASNDELAEMKKQLSKVQAHAEDSEESNKKLSTECVDLRNENQYIADQLSKIVLTLEISKTKSEQLGTEVQHLEMELKKSIKDKISMEETHNNILEQLETNKCRYDKIVLEKQELELKIKDLHNNLMAKDTEIEDMRKEISELCQNAVDNSASLAEKANNLVTEVDNLRSRLLAGEVMLEKEQETNAKLRADNQILLAKYREAKQRAETEVANSEERIKENRLELEGKLEKMKNKMSTGKHAPVNGIKPWKSRFKSCLKYASIIVIAPVCVAFFLHAYMRYNDYELQIKTKNPAYY